MSGSSGGGGGGSSSSGYEDLCAGFPDMKDVSGVPPGCGDNDELDAEWTSPRPSKKKGRLNTDFGVCGEGCGLPQINTGRDGNSVELLEFIGAGAFSNVWRAVWTAEGGAKVDVAAKVLHRTEDSDDPSFDARYQSEVAALRRVAGCPNVVQFVGAIYVPTVICTLYIQGKTLHSWLEDYRPAAARLRVALAIAAAIGRIHALGLAHRDVNSSNIIIANSGKDDDESICDDDDDEDCVDESVCWEPFLCDFGLACDVNERPEEGESGRRICHPRWRPPEVSLGKARAGEWDKCDVWCYGLLLWELVTCTLPYAGLDDKAAGLEAVSGRCPPVEDLDEEDVLGNPEIPQLIGRCLSFNPALRPSFDDIVRVLQK